MTSNHLMVDLETMDITERAAIVSIGACMFDPFDAPDQHISEQDTFHVAISLKSNEGRSIAGGTVEWWLQRPVAVQQAILTDTTSLANGLRLFTKWFQHDTNCRPDAVWANDPDFDCVILRTAFEGLNVINPLGFWMNRSMRTIGAVAYPDHSERKSVIKFFRNREGDAHRADIDAIAQARFIAQCYTVLGVERREA